MSKEFLFLGIGRVTQALIALVSLRFMTTLLTKNEVGNVYLILALSGYFCLVFANPVGMYLNRHIHELQNKKILAPFFKALNFYLLLIACASVPILFISKYSLGIAPGISYIEISLLVFLSIYGTTWFQTLGPALNAFSRRVQFISISNLVALLSLALGVTGVMFYESTAATWLYGQLTAHIFGAIISYYFFRDLLKDNSGPSLRLLFRREVWIFSFPVGISTLLQWTQTQSYRVIVESLAGAEVLASLAVGLGIAMSLCALVEAIFTQYYYPQYYQKISTANADERTRAWNILFKNSLTIYIIMAAAFISSAQSILILLAGPEYHYIRFILAIGILTELTKSLTNVIYIVSHSEFKTKHSILPYLVGGLSAALGTLFTVVFYPSTIETTLPLVLLASYTLCFLLMWAKMRTLIPLHFPLQHTFKMLLLSSPLLVMGLFTDDINSIPQALATCSAAGLYGLAILWFSRKHIADVS